MGSVPDRTAAGPATPRQCAATTNGRHRRSRIRIATIYQPVGLTSRALCSMNYIRWMRMSEGLAAAGFRVDMIVGAGTELRPTSPNLRLVTASEADWDAYHVVKTLYPQGFRELVRIGGGCHPFIISRLASVVGAHDDVAGVHYFDGERQARYATLQQIQRAARYVSLTTEPSRQLWQREFPTEPERLLLVPTGVDRTIPPPRRNPYTDLAGAGPIAVYISNLRRTGQPALMAWWRERLSRVGRLLRRRAVRLVLIGPGPPDGLDPAAVINVGAVPYPDIWDYQYFANVGLVFAEGPVQVNESSKIYHYLRTGLPVVSEAPVPNNDVIASSGCGIVVPYDDDRALVDGVQQTIHRAWDRRAAIEYVLAHHTWDHRVATYVDRIVAAFPGPIAGG